jgi:hypothetical protein
LCSIAFLRFSIASCEPAAHVEVARTVFVNL